MASVLFACQSQALALEGASSWLSNDQGRMRLVSAVDATAETMLVGLQVELDPGWKIYWRSPGESGLPPHFDWSRSENVAHVATLWPAPKRYTIFGFDTFAYADEVVYPLRVRPGNAAKPVRLELKLDYGLCREICIPYTAELSLRLPVAAAKPTVFAPLLERYLRRVPVVVEGGGMAGGLAVASAAVEGAAGQEVLIVRLRSETALGMPDILVEEAVPGAPPYHFSRPEFSAAGSGGRDMTARIAVSHTKMRSVTGKTLILTVIDGGRAIERRISLPAK